MTDRGLSGWFEAAVHHFPVRVYYADTDAAGVVYHSTYLDFAERARTEIMRLISPDRGGPDGGEDVLFVVRRCEVDYLRSARLDDLLMVRSRVTSLGGATLGLDQSFWRQDEEMARVAVLLVCVKDVGGSTRIPKSLRDKLAAFLT